MSGNKLVECAICGSQFRRDEAHECLAKETRSGSPLESVVQPQTECGVASNPDVQPGATIEEIEEVIDRLYSSIEPLFEEHTACASVAIARGLGMLECRQAIRDFFKQKKQIEHDAKCRAAGITIY